MSFIGKDRTLFRLFGVPIRVNLSWLFLVALVMMSLAQGYFPSRLGPGVKWYVHWGFAGLGTVALFVSLIAHELAHSLVARATGTRVVGITLFIFGGVSQLEDEPPTAASEFIMAVVGPLSSVAIGCALLSIWAVGQFLDWAAAPQALLWWLFFVNFMLAGFNSLPAFPLDGGRVLRSVLWAVTGDLRLATDVAGRIGSLFGFGFMFLGALAAITMPGYLIFGVWLVIIGFFLRQAALSSRQMVVMRQQLEGEKVARFMSTDVVTVPRYLDLQRFVDEYVFRHRFSYYPVVDEEGRLVGLVSARAPRKVEQGRWPYTTVEALMRKVEPNSVLRPDADAMDALSALRLGDVHRTVIVDDGRPVGMVSLRDLLSFLALKIDLQPRRHDRT